MSPKLEAVLARMIQRSPRGLSVTQASKLPYLVDLVATHVIGSAITGSSHQAWDKGVVTPDSWHAIKRGSSEHLQVGTRSDRSGRWVTLKSYPTVALTADEADIVDFVYDNFHDLRQAPLGALTKEINAPDTRWGSNQEIPLSLEAFEALPVWPGEDDADGVLLETLRRDAPSDANRFIGKEKSEAALARWAS